MPRRKKTFAEKLFEELADDLDFAESERTDYYPPSENLTGGESRMLGWCGRHTLPTDPDQELDPDPWEEWP